MNNFYRAAFAALAIMTVVAILDTSEHYVPAVSSDDMPKISAYEISQGSTTAVAPCDSSLSVKSTPDTIVIVSDRFEMVFAEPDNNVSASEIAAEICRDRQQS